MVTITSARTKPVWTEPPVGFPSANQRAVERRAMRLPGRLTWKDHRGATRFASVVTQNVSEFGVFVECKTTVSIPLYRLVQFQLEQDVCEVDGLPLSLRQGRLLSAVYRVAPATARSPQGFALRLMVDPKRATALRATA
jgi:hypothetical protein